MCTHQLLYGTHECMKAGTNKNNTFRTTSKSLLMDTSVLRTQIRLDVNSSVLIKPEFSHRTQRKANTLVMANQEKDRRATETGGSTTGDTFMFLIKVLLSQRRDR